MMLFLLGVNFLVRKMASMAKPTSDIKVDLDDQTITVTMNAGFMVKQDSYRLGEEFESDHQGSKSKVSICYTVYLFIFSFLRQTLI